MSTRPKWIDFHDNSVSPTFTFTPKESRHKRVYRVRVFALDTPGVETSVEFRLTVDEFNDPPKASTLEDQTVLEDVTLTDPTHPTSIYVFEVFTDEEDDAAGVAYRAFWASKDGEDLLNGAGGKVFVFLPEWIFRPVAGVHTLPEGIGADARTKKHVHADFVLRVP